MSESGSDNEDVKKNNPGPSAKKDKPKVRSTKKKERGDGDDFAVKLFEESYDEWENEMA